MNTQSLPCDLLFHNLPGNEWTDKNVCAFVTKVEVKKKALGRGMNTFS
jgi:hypothetical protein